MGKNILNLSQINCEMVSPIFLMIQCSTDHFESHDQNVHADEAELHMQEDY